MVADHVAHPLGKNLSSSAGQRIHPRRFQLHQSFTDRELGSLREIRHLNHGEGFEMDLGKTLLEAGNQVEKILEWQIGMQSAHDVELGHRLTVA